MCWGRKDCLGMKHWNKLSATASSPKQKFGSFSQQYKITDSRTNIHIPLIPLIKISKISVSKIQSMFFFFFFRKSIVFNTVQHCTVHDANGLKKSKKSQKTPITNKPHSCGKSNILVFACFKNKLFLHRINKVFVTNIPVNELQNKTKSFDKKLKKTPVPFEI